MDNAGSAALKEKVKKSLDILSGIPERFQTDKVAVGYTGGKDSTTLLYLIKEAFGGKVPFKVIRIDTSVKFPEINAFVDKMARLLSLDLRVYKAKEAPAAIEIAKDKEQCCHLLKTAPLLNAIRELNISALITGLRWDENPARGKEEYFSPRENPDHFRVNPILHFTEKDIWEYIKTYDIPYCVLYDRGYRSLGCIPCTGPSTNPDGPERQGRSQSKEEAMKRLRELGYF